MTTPISGSRPRPLPSRSGKANSAWQLGILLPLLGVAGSLAAAPSGARPGTSVETPDIDLRIQSDQARWAPLRADLPVLFAKAYQTYPSLPDGILEAIAFTGSRWTLRTPAAPMAHQRPQPWGLMGLYEGGDWFGDVLGAAAAALNVPRESLKQSVELEVMASAALLSQYIQEEGLSSPALEELGGVMARFSGLPDTGAVSRHAQQAYFYDILLILDRGHDDAGIRIDSQEIDWTLAFDDASLALLKAPRVRLDPTRDEVWLESEQSAVSVWRDGDDSGARTAPATTDYPPALWVASPNYSSRNGTAITHVAIHTMQGSYSGGISWCQNPDANVSAHYMMRSSDGQVTQMVREYDKAWHVGSENPYTIGIEHEGYVENSAYYTTAMYNSSGALTRDICASNKIDCSTCYAGASSSTVNVLSSSYHVKGHQHYPNQTHTDPGIYWDWPKYKSLVSSGSSGSTGGSTGSGSTTTSSAVMLDTFESSEGHFNTSPTYSGSTYGISTSSKADRTTSAKKNGSYSEKVTLYDNTSSSSSWQVRFLSASGSVSQNVALTRAGGTLGFWAYSASSGVTMALLMDDSDGLESSTAKSLPTGAWTWFEWKLDDAAVWNAWVGGNGQIDASSVTLDAIMIYRAQTSSTVYVYVDDVQYKK